ncbi:hypothetical protein SAY86_022128 [Trapa natans]|uniref:Homer protein n=1 Tax=Trapa natans TaxID=22666 RepID=A0AAN7ME40_TRANT|nr:hypothetical protein SAY86_022128 [Trapa natans]
MTIPPAFSAISSPCPRVPFSLARASHGCPRTPRAVTVWCSSGTGHGPPSGNLKDALSGMVDSQVEELLSREENRVLLDGLDRASRRVEKAKRELAEIERQEAEAKQMRSYIEHLESRASEIVESQKDILEARAMVEEAERFLSSSMERSGDEGSTAEEAGEVDKEKERLESVKAASVSAVIGTLAGLPISLTHVTSTSQLVLPLAIAFVSCALFGVTFRYTVRRDLDNFQLKSGTFAAFAFVRGLGALGVGPPLELNPESFLSHAVDGVTYVSESLLVFAFAAVGLDFCFKTGLISTFPLRTD